MDARRTRTAFASIYTAHTVLERGAIAAPRNVEIGAYPGGTCGTVWSPLHASIPQRPPAPTAAAGFRAGRKGSPETPLRFRITPVRSAIGERYCLKRCIYTTIECMHLLANAAGRRRSDGRGWTIRDESIAPVREACSIPSLGHWVAMECGDTASVPTLQGCTKVAPPPTKFFSYFLYLGADRTDRDCGHARGSNVRHPVWPPRRANFHDPHTPPRSLSDSARLDRQRLYDLNRWARTAMLPHTLVPHHFFALQNFTMRGRVAALPLALVLSTRSEPRLYYRPFQFR